MTDLLLLRCDRQKNAARDLTNDIIALIRAETMSLDASVDASAQSSSLGVSSNNTLALLEPTVRAFQQRPNVAGLQGAAPRMYATFCSNRAAELYTTFYNLVGVPDLSGATHTQSFVAEVPWAGKKNERPVCGMAKGGVMHGLIRFEYKGDLVEECRKNGKEHGLRIVCVQTGDIWIRLFQDGKRLAQIVLGSNLSIQSNPKPIDEGGLDILKSHLDLIRACFETK